MKKLPKIFQNDFSKTINNNKKICYLKNDDINNTYNLRMINSVLDDIFNGLGYPYNISVIINTDNKIYDTSLIARDKENIITLDNEIIPIKNIISIDIKND